MQPWVRALHEWVVTSRAWPVWIRYLISTGAVAAVFLVMRTAAISVEGIGYLPFLAVALLAGALLDRGNGFYATALSAILIAIAKRPVPPLLTPAQETWGLLFFVILGVVISAVVEALHRALVTSSLEHRAALSAVHDRQILLDELSHRTRNDLARLATVLSLQARTAQDETATALRAAVDRVHAVARIHRSLSLSGDHVVVDSKAYIHELCEDLQQSLGTARPIRMNWRAESHQLALDKAVPTGLILNEAVTNAVKHAFPDHRSGSISIEFIRDGVAYALTVADDGVGLVGVPSEGSLGKRLIGLLAAQLGGEASIGPNAGGGTLVRVTLPRRTERD